MSEYNKTEDVTEAFKAELLSLIEIALKASIKARQANFENPERSNVEIVKLGKEKDRFYLMKDILQDLTLHDVNISVHKLQLKKTI